MNLEVNKVYNGFRLINQEEIKDIKSVGRLFKHEKSGARLLSLFNDDDNKVFSISFRTPPEDSTGLPHILEHSVLNGSRKFPLREPFVELLKGSLKTFLNAMTSPDKTAYPVASRNSKDFFNLMNVYLDAVFYPNIYKKKEILMQEGWHYHLEKPEDKLTYKGVVYNEMKGAYSSPENFMYRRILASVLKDTIYANSSGGDPEFIPELTEEQFLNFHKKYYHPSNSYIFLYGNGDILEQLEFIDKEYLSEFNEIEVNSEIIEQEPYSEILHLTEEYSISKDDREENKAFLSLNYAVGKAALREDALGMEILTHMLLDTPSAPLKNAIIDAKLGKDVSGSYRDTIVQPIFSIMVKNSNEHQVEDFKGVVFSTLRKLVDEGIDRELIEASININEFRLREGGRRGSAKGIMYASDCMKTWLYGGEPYKALKYEDDLRKIKDNVDNNYFENLIKKYILNNTHGSIYVLRPRKGLAEERAEKLQQKLDAYKEKLSKEEIDKIVEETNKLKRMQVTKDKPEDLEKIPMVTLDDIKRDPERIPQEEKEVSGAKVLFHDIFTSGIIYTNILFDGRIIEQELIQYVALLTHLLGKVGTEHKDYIKLDNAINISTGGIKYRFDTYRSINEQEEINPKFELETKVLPHKFNSLIELLNEIGSSSKFDHKKRIKEILGQVKARMEASIMQNGSQVASERVMSYFSKVDKYKDDISGIGFYKFLCNLLKNYDELYEKIVENLTKVYKKIFNKNNMIISVTCSKDEYKIFENNIGNFINGLGHEVYKEEKYIFENNRRNEGLKTQGDVQYVAKGYNYKELGFEYSGKLQVLKTIARLDYLWNKVRVQGGAYGCMINLNRSGELVFASYRDPNIKETIEAYDATADFLKNLDISDREMRKYIIGTISGLDRPLSPAEKGEIATEIYIKNISYEYLKNEREEVLLTTKEDIKELANIFKDIMDKNYLCVLGNVNKINDNEELFKEVMAVIE